MQVRGMKLSKDVRNQLCQIIQKIAKGHFSSFSFRSMVKQIPLKDKRQSSDSAN
jgi:hypothetical protein